MPQQLLQPSQMKPAHLISVGDVHEQAVETEKKLDNTFKHSQNYETHYKPKAVEDYKDTYYQMNINRFRPESTASYAKDEVSLQTSRKPTNTNPTQIQPPMILNGNQFSFSSTFDKRDLNQSMNDIQRDSKLETQPVQYPVYQY